MKHTLYRSIFLIITFIAGSAFANDGDIDPGLYEIRQLSTGRFLDAYQNSADFSVVTREQQNNSTQRWQLEFSDNNTYTLVQDATGRFMDAYQNNVNDFSVVTRTAQNNTTQRWIIEVRGIWGRLRQRSTDNFLDPRYMDAYHDVGNDFSVVTREYQDNDSQVWIFKQLVSLSGDVYSIQQLSSRRFLDAYQSNANDFSVVTRTAQNNDTQRWVVRNDNQTALDGRFDDVTIRQVSSSRFVDAWHDEDHDFSVVTRNEQNNDSQLWSTTWGGYIVTIQQASNNRFLDAHQNAEEDFSVVTRTAQNNDSQLWLLDVIPPPVP